MPLQGIITHTHVCVFGAGGAPPANCSACKLTAAALRILVCRWQHKQALCLIDTCTSQLLCQQCPLLAGQHAACVQPGHRQRVDSSGCAAQSVLNGLLMSCSGCMCVGRSVGRLTRRMAEICVKSVLAVADLSRRDVNLDLIKVQPLGMLQPGDGGKLLGPGLWVVLGEQQSAGHCLKPWKARHGAGLAQLWASAALVALQQQEAGRP